MKKNKEIIFDKLDKKCFEEMPIMIDVISNTFNKLRTLLYEYHKKLEKIIKKELNKNIKPKNYSVFYLLVDKVKNIEKLSNKFYILYKINLTDKNEDYFFNVNVGYSLINKNSQFNNSVFYNILRNLKDRPIIEKEFYEKLKQESPSHNEDLHIFYSELEGISLYCKKLDEVELENKFDFFVEHLLLPFLKKMMCY